MDDERRARKDFWIGVGLAWLLPWIGGLILGIPLRLLISLKNTSLVSTIAMWLSVLIGPIAWFIGYRMAKRRGRPNIARGIAIGILFMIGLGILLTAACFGFLFLLSRR